MTTQVGVYEAKTHLPRLIERVQKGETITITKHGVVVAVLAPPPAARRLSAEEAMDGLIKFREELRGRGVTITQEEIRKWKHEGHKY
jgi:prevent-host-death family protein